MSNLTLWKSLEKTDPKFINDKDRKGLNSINTQYFFMKATETFGVCGIGWGYEIIEERYDEGVTITKGQDVLGVTKNHTIKLKLWFKLGEDKGEVLSFGHTPYIYSSKYGLSVDEEAPKKSLSDAIKKALSMIGVAGDVYLGYWDDINYQNDAINESNINNAADKDAERAKQAQELFKDTTKVIDQMNTSNTLNELHGLYTAMARKLNGKDDSLMIKLTKAKDENKARLENA
jgi:hypothetical protein